MLLCSVSYRENSSSSSFTVVSSAWSAKDLESSSADVSCVSALGCAKFFNCSQIFTDCID